MDVNNISPVQILAIPKICDPRGNLSFIENESQLPFAIGGVEWIYDVPSGESLPAQSFVTNRQLVVALSGSFTVNITLRNGASLPVTLSSPDKGLLIEPYALRSLGNFSTNAVALILNSEPSATDSASPTPVPQIVSEKMLCADPHQFSSTEWPRKIDVGYLNLFNSRGKKSALVNGANAPYDVQRIFYMYDLPCDSVRGGHSHFRSFSLLVAVSGCFDVTLSDGVSCRKFTLHRPYQALFVPTGMWLDIDNFSAGSICLALSSTRFEEADYVREHNHFLELTHNKHLDDQTL